MKKIISILLVAATLAALLMLASCGKEKIIVQTNAYFPPFEYYQGKRIVGADIEIMNLVGEKLGKKVVFDDVDFSVIIDNVSSGKLCDCGAAGLTITEARKEKVDFSNTYFTSVQYVIYKKGAMNIDGTAENSEKYILWDSLAGKKIGVQENTTGDLYVTDEINADENEDDYDFTGVLHGTGAKVLRFDNAQLATDAIGANTVDVVVVDYLPASYIISKNSDYECAALYYKGENGEADYPTLEEYAIAVTKGNTELLNAINEVLAELGEDGVNKLVKKHMGISD